MRNHRPESGQIPAFAALKDAARRARTFVVAGLGGLMASTLAASAQGYALPGQIGMQTPNSPVAEEIVAFHDKLLLPIIIIISLFVLGLLIYVVARFNEKANPVPSKTTHHTLLEVAWTVLPVLILIVIAIPSFRLLGHQLIIPKADVTIKITGNQWYWSYAYPKDQGGGFSFDSLIKADNEIDASKGDIRLLSVDNEAVVPVGKKIRVQVTASDVIHSFTVPAFGVRIDAVPGRLNEAWFQAEREGMYYGQCSKICGKDHAFMPIAFRVVSEQAYAAWLAAAQKKFAAVPAPGQYADSASLRQ
jgi:cytochrome c oxidase subunit 2